MTINQMLFSLIYSEIREDKKTYYNQKPDEKTFAKLYQMSSAHDVAHIVANALDKQGFIGSDETSRKFRKKKLVAMYRTEQILYDYANICDVLENNGIDFIPLKGSVIRDYYPEKWMRTSCDIDILVKKSDCEKAGEILCQNLAFKREECKTLHDVQLLSPTGVLLELHYTLIEEEYFSHAYHILEDVWSTALLSEGFNHKYELTKEAFMFYHISHMAKHILRGGCGIKNFVDLYILENKFGFDSEKIDELLRTTSLKTFYDSTIKLCHVWFDNEEHNDTTRLLEKYILDGGVYGTASNGAAMNAGKGESKVRYFFSNMFLSYDSLCVVYPNLKNKKALYPFYQVKRWFRVFDKKKREKIICLTVTRNSVSDTERDKAKELLDKLGID